MFLLLVTRWTVIYGLKEITGSLISIFISLLWKLPFIVIYSLGYWPVPRSRGGERSSGKSEIALFSIVLKLVSLSICLLCVSLKTDQASFFGSRSSRWRGTRVHRNTHGCRLSLQKKNAWTRLERTVTNMRARKASEAYETGSLTKKKGKAQAN